MNIFMITKPISPFMDEGSKNLAFNLANQIKNYKFHLMTCKNSRLPKIENMTYHYFYPDDSLNTPKINFFHKIRLFYKIFNQKDIDVYHFIFTPRIVSSLVSKMFFKLSGKKSVQTISTPLTKSKLKMCLFADKIVVLSEWTRRRVLDLEYKNVIKIGPGIDPEIFSKENINTARKKLGVSEEDFVILFPGEYIFERGAKVILNILKRLVENFPHVKVIFACRPQKGDTKEKKLVIDAVNSFGLSSNVIFLGRIDFMPELINSSDIVVLPIISQFFKMEIPMVLLEALALEKPVIISDIPPLNEMFSGNEAGIKIQPGNSEDLLKSITLLIKNKNLRNKMGKAGRALVEKEFNIKEIAKEYNKIYKELETE